MSASEDFPDNKTRAVWAEEALACFAARTHIQDEETQTQLQDLIGDLFHLCHENKIPILEVLQMALHHYEEECVEAGYKPQGVSIEREPWMG